MEVFIILLVIVIIIIIPNVKIVPQSKAYVIERLGSYLTIWHNGLHFKIPFIDRIANVVLFMASEQSSFMPSAIVPVDGANM